MPNHMNHEGTGAVEPPAGLDDQAMTALDHARRHDMPAAIAALVDIKQRHGSDGVMQAAMIWCDAYKFALRVPADDASTTRPVWFDLDAGRFTTADDTPPPARWAGRFLAARIVMDRAQCEALITSCGRTELADGLAALLISIARTMNLANVPTIRAAHAMTEICYFGARWDAPVLDPRPGVDIRQVPTPVGVACLYCHEPIRDGDRGLLRATRHPPTDTTGCDPRELIDHWPVHLECDLRSVMGSVAHLTGRCTCAVGVTEEPDYPGTAREEALAVLAIVNAQRAAQGYGPL